MLKIETNREAKDQGILDLINEIDEFRKISDYMNDEHLDDALSNVVKLVLNPAVPAIAAPKLIVHLSAISAVMQMKAKWYMTVEKGKAGTPENTKKELYLTVSDRLDFIVQALKFSAK